MLRSLRIATLFLGAAIFFLDAQIRFEEVARKAGLDFQMRNGSAGRFHQVELIPAGMAAFDYDNDGCTDIY